MKRTQVILDEELLEKARRVGGQKTYSATINKALEAMVKQDQFRQALKRFEDLTAEGNFFWPGYLEEVRPNAYMVQEKKKKRVSAHEQRAPKGKKVTSRGSR
ncbi:MAG TPA: type II toxin-antitoxin system VapB family antitoxin [Thermoanaerobaculia bacterium]|jgi:hypothetical protein